MSFYYSIYAEARVGNNWYNISPLMRNSDGDAKAQPIISGQSWMKEAVDEFEEACFMHGRPSDISNELKKVFYHEDNEVADHFLHDITYKEYYRQTLFVVNYGKAVKSRVKKDRAARYQGNGNNKVRTFIFLCRPCYCIIINLFLSYVKNKFALPLTNTHGGGRIIRQYVQVMPKSFG